MRPLTEEEYGSLKDGISEDGIVSSIVIDANGDVIDGHTRLEAWAELLAEGKPSPSSAPVVRRTDLSEPKAIKAMARKLNLQRRQLSTTDRRKVVKAQIVDTPEKSDNAIALMLGVHHSVAKTAREQAISEGLIVADNVATDSRGRKQPRTKEHASNANVYETETLENNANSKESTNAPAASETSRAPSKQTTVDEHIQESKDSEKEPVGSKTVKEAVQSGAPPFTEPKRTKEEKVFTELFPYLNELLELDPVEVAQASNDPTNAQLSTILFKEVIPWFEKFFSTLEEEGSPTLRAVK